MMNSIIAGIDVGTTSISMIALDAVSGDNLQAFNRPHHAQLPPDGPGASLQDPSRLFAAVRDGLGELAGLYHGIDAIGITGQMHGIVPLDKYGSALGPAYTWLDGRGAWMSARGISYVRELEERFGMAVPAGFGLVTLYTLLCMNELPPEVAAVATVPGYIAMRLTGGAVPRTGASLAHSLGGFSLSTGGFLPQWEEALPVPPPAIAPPATAMGTVATGPCKGTPVIVPEGDNQASFLASVQNPDRVVLFNIGTSSQVSLLRSALPAAAKSTDVATAGALSAGLEPRPFPGGDTLLVGAGLSGGKAFEVLALLIQEINKKIGGTEIDPNVLFHSLSDPPDRSLRIDARFAGTRSDHQQRGSISNIGLSNLTLPNLYWGIAEGVIGELLELLGGNRSILDKPDTYVIISGRAGEESTALRHVLGELTGRPPRLLKEQEAAARGAAILATAYLEGGIETLPKLRERLIIYKDT